MLQNCAAYLTDTLYQHCKLLPERRPIYQYGFELIISTLCSFCSILLLSILLGDVFSAILFLGIFFFLRLCSGGYHAPTYARCFILTNAVYLSVYFVSRFFLAYQWGIPAVVITVLSGIVIFVFAPIRNKKHPISEGRLYKNKRIARVLVTLEMLTLVTLVWFRFDLVYISVPTISLAAVAVMMIIPKIQERRE